MIVFYFLFVEDCVESHKPIKILLQYLLGAHTKSHIHHEKYTNACKG